MQNAMLDLTPEQRRVQAAAILPVDFSGYRGHRVSRYNNPLGAPCHQALAGLFLAVPLQGELRIMSSMTNLKRVTVAALVAGLLMVDASWRVALAQTVTNDVILNAETFAAIHEQIKPQPDESRWMEIPWLTDLHEARRKAATEGKPLFLMVSGKGLSIGMC